MDKQVAYLDTYYKLWYKDGLTMRDIVPKVSFVYLPRILTFKIDILLLGCCKIFINSDKVMITAG